MARKAIMNHDAYGTVLAGTVLVGFKTSSRASGGQSLLQAKGGPSSKAISPSWLAI